MKDAALERRVRAKLRSFLREAPIASRERRETLGLASPLVASARPATAVGTRDTTTLCAEDALLASASSLDGSLDASYGSDDFGNSGDFEAFFEGGTRRDARARILAQTRRRVSPGTRAERFQLALADILDHNVRAPRVRVTRTTARVSRVFRSRSYYIIVGSSSSRVRSRRVRVSPFFFFFFSETSHAARARDAAGASAPDFRLFRPSLKWWNFSSASYPRTTLISADPPATTTSTVSSGAARSTA